MVTSPSPICVVIGSTPLCAPVCDPVSGLLFQQPPDGRSGRLPIVLEDLAPPKPSASGLTELRSSTNLPPKSMHQRGATVWCEPPPAVITTEGTSPRACQESSIARTGTAKKGTRCHGPPAGISPTRQDSARA